MKVLVISRNAWDDTNAIGNTVSNFFAGIEDLEFANIYFRSARPNNKVCSRYYRVTEGEVLKNWFSPQKNGKQFLWNEDNKARNRNKNEKSEKKLVRFIHKHNLGLAYKLSDYVWNSKRWMNGNLKHFVEDFSPDIVFTFVKSAPQYYLTVRYLRETFGIPVLSWIADDEYTALNQKNNQKMIDKLRYILKESAVVRGCSAEICEYYNSVFGCSAEPLYKGCDLTTPVKTTTGQPIKMVYAGNLLYGRLEILRCIADILEDVSCGEGKATLEVYSNTLISAEDESFFSQKTCTRYMGRRDYEAIMQELASADVVLHVESFEKEQLLKTKYSFSTKIIDCLQSGSVLLAVGPEEQASMRYIRGIPGTFVIDDPLQLRERLMAFLGDASSFGERAQRIREYAQKYHDAAVNARELGAVMKKIVEGDL